MGPIGCPETSVTDYKSRLYNIREEQRYYLHRGENLKIFIGNVSVTYVEMRELWPISARELNALLGLSLACN
jgi:hypothetical protein